MININTFVNIIMEFDDGIDVSYNSIKKPYIALKGKNKKFDQVLYDKYDIPARDIVKSKLGVNVKDNPDIYAEDLVIDDPICKYKFIELQVCANWIDKYPYDEPFVYERKGHFSDDTLFIIFDKNMNRGLLFDKISLKEKPNRIKKYSRTFVYQIPWLRIMPFFVNNLDMDMIYSY
jgi:hypothetical protein